MADRRRSGSKLEYKKFPGFNAHKIWYFVPAIALGLGAVVLNLTAVAPNLVGWGEFTQGVIFNSANIPASIAGLTGLACEVASIPIVGALAYNGIRKAVTYKKYKLASEAIIETDVAEDMTDYELELEDTKSLINSVFVDHTKDSALVRYLDLADTHGKKHLTFAKSEKLVHEEDYIKLVISKLCDRLAELSRLKHRGWATSYRELSAQDVEVCKEEMETIQKFLRQVINKRDGVEPFAKTIMSKMQKYRKDKWDGKTYSGLELIPDEDGNAKLFNRLLTQGKIKDAFLEAFKFSASRLSDEDTVSTPEQRKIFEDEELKNFLAYLESLKETAKDAVEATITFIDNEGRRVTTKADDIISAMNGEYSRVKTSADGTITLITNEGRRVLVNADNTISFISDEGKRVTTKADETITFIGDEGKRVTATVEEMIDILARATKTGKKAIGEEVGKTIAKVRKTGKIAEEATDSVRETAESVKTAMGTEPARVKGYADATTRKIKSTADDAEADIKETERRAKQSMTDRRTHVAEVSKDAKTDIKKATEEVEDEANRAKENIGRHERSVETKANATKTKIEMLYGDVETAKAQFDRDLTDANKALSRISTEHVALKIDIVNKWYSNVLKQISAFSEEEISDFIAFMEDFGIIRDTVIKLASDVGGLKAIVNANSDEARNAKKIEAIIVKVLGEFDKTFDKITGERPSDTNLPALRIKVSELEAMLEACEKEVLKTSELAKLNAGDIANLAEMKAGSKKGTTIQTNPETEQLKKTVTKIKNLARLIAYYREARPNDEIVVSPATLSAATKYIKENKIMGPVNKTTKNISYTPDEMVGAWFNDFMRKSNVDVGQIKDLNIAIDLLGDVQARIERYNAEIRRKQNEAEFARLTKI